jgi:hypothetical protein
VEYGYVDTIQRRGEYIKTYEGSLIRYREIHDTTRVYTTDFIFSTPDAQGRLLQRFLGSGRPVKVTYKVYNCVLPWRGERREVVMRVDTISPDSILPPEFDARAYAHPAVGDTIYKTN